VKTCANCQHYYATRQLCEAPMPLWLDDYDPIGNIASDEHTTMPPETNATMCRTYRKRRVPNTKVEFSERSETSER